MKDFEEVYDQAGLVGDIFSLHLQQHKNGKTDPECDFCKNWIIPSILPEGQLTIESYKFIIFDVSENK
jgi:hypothetical protein